MKEFKVGDLVKVVNEGATYSSYDTMFKLLGFKNNKENLAKNFDGVGEIFSITKHYSNKKRTLAALRDSKGNEILINVDGIELYKKPVQKITVQQMDILKGLANAGKINLCESWVNNELKYFPYIKFSKTTPNKIVGTRHIKDALDFETVLHKIFAQKEVVLTDDYTAIIKDGFVQVGCQEISFDKVEELYKTVFNK